MNDCRIVIPNCSESGALNDQIVAARKLSRDILADNDFHEPEFFVV